MVMWQNTLDLDFLAMDSLFTDALQLFRFYWNGGLLQQFVQVRSLEQPVAIRRIPVHREFATSGPITDRVVVDSEVISSF